GQTWIGSCQVATDANGALVSSPDGSATIIADGSGNVSFVVHLAASDPGQVISATATDLNGNTSEFSADVVSEGQPMPTLNDTLDSDDAGNWTAPEGSPIDLWGGVDYFPEVTFTWTVTKNGVSYPFEQNGISISFTPDDNGTYVVSLTETDLGGTGTTSRTI